MRKLLVSNVQFGFFVGNIQWPCVLAFRDGILYRIEIIYDFAPLSTIIFYGKNSLQVESLDERHYVHYYHKLKSILIYRQTKIETKIRTVKLLERPQE